MSLLPPPPSELILTAGFELMGSPYPPSLLTFFRAGVRYRIFFLCSNPLSDVRCLLLSRSTRRALFLAVLSRQGAALGGEC